MNRNDTLARVQETAAAVAEKVREARLDERAAELASLAMDKLRETELDARAAELAATTRKVIRDADLDAKAAEIAAAARERFRESGLDDVAADVVARVRDAAIALQSTDVAQQAAGAARGATDRTLERVGDWLSDTSVGARLGETAVGHRMGLQPAKKRPWWLVGVVAAAVGAAVAVSVLRKQRGDDEARWDLEDAGTGTPDTPFTEQKPLEDRVREALGQDPRTGSFPRLNVNIVSGTVFVRGAVGADVDQKAIRSVIEGVEGVTDVDLQLTVDA